MRQSWQQIRCMASTAHRVHAEHQQPPDIDSTIKLQFLKPCDGSSTLSTGGNPPASSNAHKVKMLISCAPSLGMSRTTAAYFDRDPRCKPRERARCAMRHPLARGATSYVQRALRGPQ